MLTLSFFWCVVGRQLGDLALSSGNLKLAQDCAKYSDDLAGQLIFVSSLGSAENMQKLGERARQKGRFNIAFLVGAQSFFFVWSNLIDITHPHISKYANKSTMLVVLYTFVRTPAASTISLCLLLISESWCMRTRKWSRWYGRLE